MKKELKNKSKISKKVLTFILCMLFVYLVAAIGSTFTIESVKSDWYKSIKPSITPPDYLFGPVWTVLFFLIGWSLYLCIESDSKKDKGAIIKAFEINLFLNLIWSFLFFYMKNPLFAFIDLLFLWFSILFLILTARKFSKAASWLLVPYLLWVSFAGVLNYLAI